MFDTIINYFKPKPFDKYKKLDEYIHPESLNSDFNFDKIIPSIDLKNYSEKKRNILIMDDFSGMAQLLKEEMLRVQCCSIETNFNILLATGSLAAFSVKDAIKNELQIDIAFLDITLGGIIDGIEYDGIDVAIMLKKANPLCVIRFVTGHTLNRYNPEIFQFIKKFEDFFEVQIDETEEIYFKDAKIELYKHIINKNGNRVEAMGGAFQEYLKIIQYKDPVSFYNVTRTPS